MEGPEVVRVRRLEGSARGPRKSEDAEALGKLWRSYRLGRSVEDRNALAERYLHLVRYQANYLNERTPGSVDVQDLEAAGFFGLLDAIKKFDPSRGFKFETYCVPRIRGAMLDDLRGQDHVGRLTRTRANRLEKEFDTLEKELRRPPSDAELARRLKVSLDGLDGLMMETRHAFPAMRRRPFDKDPNVPWVEFMEDRTSLNAVSAADLLRAMRARLPVRSCWIFMLYHLHDLSLAEIATAFGLSESRTCQLLERAGRILRARLSLDPTGKPWYKGPVARHVR